MHIRNVMIELFTFSLHNLRKACREIQVKTVECPSTSPPKNITDNRERKTHIHMHPCDTYKHAVSLQNTKPQPRAVGTDALKKKINCANGY